MKAFWDVSRRVSVLGCLGQRRRMCQGLPCRTFKESVLGRVAGSVEAGGRRSFGKAILGRVDAPTGASGKLFGACRGDCRGIADGRRSFGENVVVS